jgi:hypothetical protein
VMLMNWLKVFNSSWCCSHKEQGDQQQQHQSAFNH